MLHIHKVKKSYGSFEVLDIPSLQLENGKYWIKGVNGSGKSTFLKILAGLLPFKGDVIIDNRFSIIKNGAQYRSLVNYAPAEPLYPSFITGQQLAAFYTAIKKTPPEKMDFLKEMLAIGNWLNNPTGSYSSGMMKKLSLLLALLGNPKLILLDEPFTTLDTQTQHSLQDFIKRENKVSLIITSHHDISINKMSFTKVFTIQNKMLEEHS